MVPPRPKSVSPTPAHAPKFMKIPSSRDSRNLQDGFAMVVVVSIMILLSALALGVLGLSTTVLRAQDATGPQIEAEANARLALQMAIGQLQGAAGPDLRATASASFANPSFPESWTGVWTTGEEQEDLFLPAVGHGAQWQANRLLRDRREGIPSWRNDWFVKPLVTEVEGAQGTENVVLASADGQNQAVEVPSVDIGVNGSLAWWTDDRSQRVSLAGGRNGDEAGDAAWASAPRYRAEAITEDEGEPWRNDFFESDEQRRATVSDQTLALAAGRSTLRSQSNGIGRSYGLFTDPVFGGLKGDLSRIVSSAESELGQDASFNLAGVQLDQSILTEDFHQDTGPVWERFRSWFQSMRGNNEGSLAYRAPDEVRRAVGALGGEGFSIDAVNTRQMPIHPMVVDVGFHWDFTPRDTSGETILCHIYPRVSLWNPYNVELSSEPLVILMPKHIDSGGGLSVEIRTRQGIEVLSSVVPGVTAQFLTPGSPNEHYFMFTIEPTTFGPGECLVFTPRVDGNNGMQPYDDRTVSNNVLTSEQPVGPENFAIELFPRTSALAENLRNRAQVLRYITTPWDFGNPDFRDSLHWNPKPFLLKQARGGSFSSQSVLLREQFPTIQRLYINDGGGGRNFFAPTGQKSGFIRTSPEWNDSPQNNGSPWGTFASNPNRLPPRRWHYRAHLSWLDDIDELQVVGRVNNPQPPYQSSVFADWNPIASVVCRTPATYLLEHFDLHVGPWYRCKAPYDAHGPGQNWGVFIDGRARGCPTANPLDFASQLSFPAIDLPNPQLPLQSLGQLRHAPLSPWLWHPLRVVGNSRPSLHAEADQTSLSSLSGSSDPWTRTVVQTDAVFQDIVQSDDHDDVLLYDISYSVNRRLWDSFFASSWEEDFAGDLDELPNAFYHPHPTLRPRQEIVELSRRGDNLALWLSAYLLVNEGAFNVNTLSVDAWEAFLGGLKDIPRPDAQGNNLSAEHSFSRFRRPESESGIWDGGAGLDDSQIETLATTLVEVIRERGPFLGVSDFVNRRLTTVANQSRAGALDEAIVRSAIRIEEGGEHISSADDSDSRVPGNQRLVQEHSAEWLLDGTPGVIEQSDILEPLGGLLTARGDTFRIRAMGVSKNAAGNVLATAYCEAIVTRSPEYLVAGDPEVPRAQNGANSALVPPYIQESGSSALQPNPVLDPINQRFGRRFEMIDFRWLKPSEI